MRLKWISGITAMLIVSACGTVTAPPSQSRPVEGANVDAPRAAPLPAPAPPVQPPPPDPEPLPPGRMAEELQDRSTPPAEESGGEPAAGAADPERNIFFPAGRTQVDKTGKALLRRFAGQVKKDPDLVITLIGHVDPLGSRSYSLALAEQRLDSVYQTLHSLGVPRGQIRRINSGRAPLDLSCKSMACRRLAWRVEILVTQ